MNNNVSTMDICSSGMKAEWRRMQVISRNLANAENTRTEDGNPYKKKYAVFKSTLDEMNGVDVEGTTPSRKPFRRVFRPEHPHANDKGMVKMPNVRVPTETVDMMSASRAYRANFKAMKNFQKICRKTLELIG